MKTVSLALSLCALGFGLNWFLENHSLGRWGDLLLPTVAVWLVGSGLVAVVLRRKTRGVPIPLFIGAGIAVLYASFAIPFQFIYQGDDIRADSEEVIRTVARSGVIPTSKPESPRPAAYSLAGRYGIWLRKTHVVYVYGVTDRDAQARVLEALHSHRTAHPIPIRVVFFESENWSTWGTPDSGTSGGSRGAERIIRVAMVP